MNKGVVHHCTKNSKKYECRVFMTKKVKKVMAAVLAAALCVGTLASASTDSEARRILLFVLHRMASK